MKKLLLLFALVLFAPPIIALAQIEYTNSPPMSASEMAQKIMGKGLQISNAQLFCGDDGSGFFWNAGETNLGMESGIILTSGTTSIAFSPNDSGSASGAGGPGYPPLEEFPWAYNGTFNACVLDFDFTPYGSEINYIFGSEEYPEWVGCTFNDIFVILIEGLPEYPPEMPITHRNM